MSTIPPNPSPPNNIWINWDYEESDVSEEIEIEKNWDVTEQKNDGSL